MEEEEEEGKRSDQIILKTLTACIWHFCFQNLHRTVSTGPTEVLARAAKFIPRLFLSYHAHIVQRPVMY